MSKILIELTQAEADALIDHIGDLAENHDDSAKDENFDRLVDIHAKAVKAIETQTHFSVLEWHPVSEAPSSNAERVFVEYSDGGFGFIFGHPEIIKDDPGYKRWAYLPE